MISRIHELAAPHVSERPDHAALIDLDDTAISYERLDQMVREAADFLGRHGLRPGDRLLIVAENCAALAVAIFAASRLDAIATPVNARMTAPELARIRAHAEPRVVIYTSAVSADARTHAEGAGAAAVSMAGFAVHVEGDLPATPEPVSPGRDHVAALLYTTGTMGTPKGVMLTHGNLLYGGEASAALRSLQPADVIYGVLPITHVFGLNSMLVAASWGGATIRLAARFTAAALYDALCRDVTILPAVPQMHALLMGHARSLGLTRLEGGRLRYVSSGAAPLDPDWKRRAEAFYGLPLQNGYGMTESTAGITVTRNPPGALDVSVGKPFPGVEVRLDPSVGAQADGGVGEILTRGPHVMKGYFRAPEETAKVLDAAGWLRTGDLGRFDADGNLHVVGRSRELIIRSGFNVYPPEVEAALNDHPAVVQSAVVGRSLAGNEEVLAFVQIAEPGGVTVAELAAHAAARLSPYKRPSRIVLATALPAAATGKILKHRLIDHFAEQLSGPSDAS
ncbi:class I adenylate-forming enzyme family protein [Pararhodobacter sp. SW119]|uniref:class I adenylate-forming enzyme family protein n=1 Tax=Pararhodobacter sp. SW119 TaxID=2780075 RepID=UPI001AE08B61|nr:class I adenylate-forming enzyme family protein [Pararhodobacter sp. SW119]